MHFVHGLSFYSRRSGYMFHWTGICLSRHVGQLMFSMPSSSVKRDHMPSDIVLSDQSKSVCVLRYNSTDHMPSDIVLSDQSKSVCVLRYNSTDLVVLNDSLLPT